MNNKEYLDYLKIIVKVLKSSNNIDLSLKLFKTLIITSSLQNILSSKMKDKKDYEFGKCIRAMDYTGFIINNSRVLENMFNFRNYIAHSNNLIVVFKVFDKIDMQDIDYHFETVLKFCEYYSPFNNEDMFDKSTLNDVDMFIGNLELESSDIPDIL